MAYKISQLESASAFVSMQQYTLPTEDPLSISMYQSLALDLVFKEHANDWISVNLLVHHQTQDAHHGGTSVVQLNASLSELGFGAELVPSEINESIAEVTREFSITSDVLHDKELKNTNEKDDLSKSGLRNGVRARDGGKTVGVVRELITIQIDAPREVDSSSGGDLSKECKHGDTTVLQFNVSEAVELRLISVGNESQRIVESKRLLGSKLLLKRVEGDRT